MEKSEKTVELFLMSESSHILVKLFTDLSIREKGAKIWERIDASLPKATGVSSKDEDRLRLFSKCVKQLSYKEYALLWNYIAYTLCHYQIDFCEHTSRFIENFEYREKRIASAHLTCMLNNMPWSIWFVSIFRSSKTPISYLE